MLRGIGLDDFASQNSVVNALFGMSRGCIKVIDRGGSIVRLNPCGMQLLELDSAEQVLGVRWSLLWPEESRSRVERAFATAMNGYEDQFTAPCPTARGTPRWWDVTVAPIYNDAGDVAAVLGVSHDVTFAMERENALATTVDAQRQALSSMSDRLAGEMRRLADANARLLHAERVDSVGRFAAGIVHDLRNVLAVAASGAHVLQEMLDGEPREVADTIALAAADGASLATSLLTLSRREAQQPRVFDVAAHLRDSSRLLKAMAGANVTLDIQAPETPAEVTAPSAELTAVLLNLVSNARDAMPDGGHLRIGLQPVSAYQRPDGLEARDYYRLTIEDTGSGMSAELVERVLHESFVTTKGEGLGTGLGLPTARQFAEEVGGRLTVESAPGRGTQVHLYLPTSHALSLDDAMPETTALHGHATVLVAVEDAASRTRIVQHLDGLGYEVLEAGSASLALAAFVAHEQVDLAICDLAFVHHGAERLSRRLQAHRGELPVLFLASPTGRPTAPAHAPVLDLPLTCQSLGRAVLDSLGRLAAPAH